MNLLLTIHKKFPITLNNVPISEDEVDVSYDLSRYLQIFLSKTQ